MTQFAGSLADVMSRAVRELLGTRCHSVSVINVQNGTATFDSVTEPDAKISYSIDGAAYAAADVTNQALTALSALQTPVTGQAGFYVQPASKTVYYVVVINAAGTVYTIQGTYADQVLSGSLAIGPRGDGSIPGIAVPATYAPIGVIKVVTGTATFTPATTFWDAANITSAGASPVNVLPAAAASLTFTEGGA